MMRRLLVIGVLALAACQDAPEPAPAPSASVPADAVRAAIRVTSKGFEPAEVKLRQGLPGVLELTRETESDCLKAVRMPWMEEAVDLPLGKPVAIPVDTSKAGTFAYSCWMSMVFGRVTIE